MATILEEEDVVAFAKKVVRCSDKSRQSFLRQFYKEKDPVLEGAFVEEDEEEHEDDEGKKNTPCKQPHKDGRCLFNIMPSKTQLDLLQDIIQIDEMSKK